MTEKKNYPEEIYKDFPICGSEQGNIIAAYRSGRQHAYDLGYQQGQRTQGDPLAGWSNLTEAIKAGERIDWERLDGLEAKCVHPGRGTLTHRLERDNFCFSNSPGGWYINESANVWKQAIFDSWHGQQSWSLWVKGDLPLRKQTADQLALGTCFRAHYKKGAYIHTYDWAQVVEVAGIAHVACYNERFTHVIASYDLADVEVLEVYGVGTFPTRKENA